jgi:hypothetical protein
MQHVSGDEIKEFILDLLPPNTTDAKSIYFHWNLLDDGLGVTILNLAMEFTIDDGNNCKPIANYGLGVLDPDKFWRHLYEVLGPIIGRDDFYAVDF